MRRLFSAFTTTWILVFGAEVLAAGPAAQPTPPTAPAGKAPPAATATPPVEVDGAGKAEALSREHFDKGRRLLVDGACAAAVPEFLESRRLKPSRAATSSAAVCLRKLERYDEALFLMEALLREFVDLPADVKTAAQKEVLDLRALVGTLEIAGAEPGTTVIVNGQVKGEVPLLAPLRLPAGIHLVRLYKEGFEPREVRAEVKGQETTRVSLPLARLLQSGKLRVDEASGAALEVVIDGTAVGRTPWEGPVAVGEHTLSLRGEADLGTVPKTFSIQQNKDVTLSLTAEKLDATLEIAPKPVDASVAVDGIFVGRGAFSGRLRPGPHTVKVVADGYFEAERELTVERGAESRLAVSLKRDPDSPAWRRPGRFSVEVAGALALSPSLGGDVAECEMCNAGFGMGGQVVVHGGFETWRHFGFGASVGYVTVQQTITDRAAAVDVVGLDRPDLGVATDTLTLRAFQAGVWGAYRLGPERIPIRLRAGAGVLLGTVTDRRTGVFRKGGEAGGCAVKDGALTDAGCFAVGPVIETPFASFFYLAPEVRAGYRLGDHLELSVGVAALVSFGLTRPRWNGDSPLANQDHPINASPDGYGTFPSETLAGTVSVTVLPSVAVRYEL